MTTEKNKPRIAVSFSGGKTSAVMTKLIHDNFKATHDISTVFANTGCEHEETLNFVDRCDKHFGWGVVWVEAVVDPEVGKGIRHKVVTFETASRNGEPFEDDIKKHGLPGPGYLHCTRDLKEGPISDYLKNAKGWGKGSFLTAIGIRADEIDRVSSDAKKRGFIYPLIKAGWTKELIKEEVAKWPFNLELKGEHYGNCVWCWKKSLRKLMTLAKDDPKIFDFPRRMEETYSLKFTGRNDDGKRFFFRGRITSDEIISLSSSTRFQPYADELPPLFTYGKVDPLDIGASCGESCEIGSDD